MKKIYSSSDVLLVNHLRNLLESYGVPCEVRNEVLRGAIGELPPTECWPELWVIRDAQVPTAEQVIKTAFTPSESALSPWSCAQCGEKIEGQFTQCWQCGAEKSTSY